MNVTPLEILSLAHTRRTDPELALKLATEAGLQHTPTGWKERPADKEDNENERTRENTAGRNVAIGSGTV